MKAYKLITGELLVGTEVIEEDNNIKVKYPHFIVPNPSGIGLVPFGYLTEKNNEVLIKKDAIIGEYEVRDEIIIQLKAKESGIKIEKPQPNFKQPINEIIK